MSETNIYSVNIDFDYASKCWLENKVKLGEGMYRYRCIAKTKKGEKCQKKNLKQAVITVIFIIKVSNLIFYYYTICFSKNFKVIIIFIFSICFVCDISKN